MNNDVKEYFREQYKNCDFRVVPGHWPDFKNRHEVDNWISLMNLMTSEGNN